jgi:leader peptidase (prepilin peptidase)/N-methyltransferase
MTSPARTLAPAWLTDWLHVLAVTPLLRWLIAHHTVPNGQPWRTTCEGCGNPLWPAACRPTGRCGGCRARCGPPPYLVEAVALTAAATLAASAARGWPLAAHAAWAAGAVTLAFTDIAVRRLPHRVTAATSIAFLTLLLPVQDATGWLRAAAAGLALTAFLGAIALAAPRDLGLGDVTVAFPVGAILGWHSWPALAAGSLLGLAAASVVAIGARLAHRAPPDAHLPLGPYLLAGGFLAAVVS